MLGPLLAIAVAAAPPPDDATLVYFNARVALRERRPTEVLKLWLLRNTLESHTGRISPYDEDFVSLAWVALGELGLCQDGLHLDEDGAGLWPVALHNWFLKNMRESEPGGEAAPFDAFDLPQQHRFVSLEDVLDAEELKSVRFFRTRCARLEAVLDGAGRAAGADPRDRAVRLRVLDYLLQTSLRHMDPELVSGRSVVEARLLDLRLAEIGLEGDRARRAAREAARELDELGVEPPDVEDEARAPTVRRLLRVAARWSADDWLALEPERRLYFYDWLRRSGLDEARQAELRLRIIDRLLERREGREVEAWIAHAGDDRASIYRGERGRRLLALDEETGFRERAVIALHRGVDAVAEGRLPDGLRAFAYALHHARDSRDPAGVRRLGLRWLSYIASRYQVTETLLATLVELVPRADLSRVLEDLVWDAALAADGPSFRRAVAAHQGRGALRRRIARLVPLANGDAGAFVEGLRADMEDSPRAVLRFVERFLERLQTQDGDVRAEHRVTLRALRRLLDAHGTAAGKTGSLARRADALLVEAGAMLAGLAALDADDPRERARALGPTAKVFAGSIRLAPSDPLPWPFRAPFVRAPSVFTPIRVTPVEPPGAAFEPAWRLGR